MTNLQKKMLSAVATGALLFNSMVPVFAQTTELTITGNGSDSDNHVNVTQQSETQVVQNNTANITNNVTTNASTGGNEANKNTSGDVTVKTGDASTTTGVSNTANSNVAQVSGCCAQNAAVTVSSNGSDSNNTAKLDLGTSTEVYQDNVANIKNTVDANASSGRNEAEKNTGANVKVETGDATTAAYIQNQVNSNVASIGGGSAGAGSVSLMITGNGEDSYNKIDLGLARSMTLKQDNSAEITNKVDADATTGKNEAEDNTGGNVEVSTGDASSTVGVDNMANFNVADLGCGCMLDLSAKVAGNGTDSNNTIKAEVADLKAAFQDNAYDCGGYMPTSEIFYMPGDHGKACNTVSADAATGANEVKDSTGSTHGDPTVSTGDAATLTSVSTTANSNVLSDGTGLELPNFDFNFDFGVNWSMMWAWLSGMSS